MLSIMRKSCEDKATLRRLIKINEETANVCYLENKPLEEILDETEKTSV